MSTPNNIYLVWGFHDYEGAYHYTGYDDCEAAVEHAKQQHENDPYAPHNMGILHLYPGDTPGTWYIRETDIRFKNGEQANEYWEPVA